MQTVLRYRNENIDVILSTYNWPQALGKISIKIVPKILGRISGEQEYPENLHRCVFDHEFLQYCLTYCGFEDIQSWDPAEEGFVKDSSFDHIDGVNTSLNLKARVGRKGIKKIFKR